MEKVNSAVRFMKIYNLILDDLSYDSDSYVINVYYDIDSKIFSLDFFNDSKKMSIFHKNLFLELNEASELKSIIRSNFIKKYDIYLPCIYSCYGKTTHILKNHKFVLNIDILNCEFDAMENSQEMAKKKMLQKK